MCGRVVDVMCMRREDYGESKVWVCGCVGVCVRAPVNHTCERVGGCARGSRSNLGCLIEVGRHRRRQADDRGWLRT